MFSIGEVLLLLMAVSFLILCSVFLGAFIVHRAKSTLPGAGFLTGGVPKGEVFTMKDEIDSLDDGAEAEVLAKNRVFNTIFGETKP
jgi:hypothetical protein